jgi:hypothetical protein
MEEEAKEAAAGVLGCHDVTLSAFITEGLAIEDEQ